MASVERGQTAARLVATVAGFIGLVALVGWVLGLATLTRMLPGLASMKVNTALCVLLLALAWWLPRRAAAVAPAVVLAITVGTLIEHAGPDLHLDNLLIQAPTTTAHPGRMAIATASCLAMLAAAELAVAAGRRRLVPTAALLALACSCLMLSSYLYGLHSLYTVGPFSTVALPTAIALVLLSVAVLFGVDGSRLWWAVEGRDAGATLLRHVLPWTVVGIPVLGYLREQGQRAGWYGTSFGLALMVTTSTLALALILFQAARRLAATDQDRSAAIAELRTLNDDLDARVSERTRDLERERADLMAAESAARAAQNAAERADAAKEEFLSRMSHELRTPLNAVLGFAQLLELEALPARQAEAVDHILRGGRHLLAMINDVLDITGINADRLELSEEPLLVTDLVIDALSLMQPAAAAAGVSLHYSPADPDEAAGCQVLSDRRRVQQVLLNLLSNAVKYNRPAGHVDVAITVLAPRHPDPAGSGPPVGEVWIAIRDTGIGIAAEDLPRLFTPFDRLGREASEIEGSGIGMALSARLVTLLGGRLEVESEPGTGSTFTLTLPTWQDDEPPAGSPPPPAAPARLLSIDSNATHVAMLTDLIGRRPEWTMTHSGSGARGVDEAVARRPSAILLECRLADADGLDVLRALKSDPRTADVPVAVVGGERSSVQARRLLAAGAQQFLAEPLDIREILTFLDGHA